MNQFGCVEHYGERTAAGYGLIGRRVAHLVEWERVHGPLPPDRVLDHACRNRPCKALHHLEPVTRAENELRKSMSYRLRRAKCPRGHDLKLHRVMTPQGGSVCRLCNREAMEGR